MASTSSPTGFTRSLAVTACRSCSRRTAWRARWRFCILTYFHIVIGEMVPKSLALQRAEQLALWITPPMFWIRNALFPFVARSLSALGNYILKLIGVNRQTQNADQYYTVGGTAAHRAGERRPRRDSSRIRSDAAGTVRVRRSDGRRGDGSAGPGRRHSAWDHA